MRRVSRAGGAGRRIAPHHPHHLARAASTRPHSGQTGAPSAAAAAGAAAPEGVIDASTKPGRGLAPFLSVRRARSASTRSATSAWVGSASSTPNGGARCSMASAISIAAPAMMRWPPDERPITTSPVQTPVRLTRRTPQSWSSSSLSSSSVRRARSAASTPRAAWSVAVAARPNTATIASPITFSTRPPCASSTWRIVSM